MEFQSRTRQFLAQTVTLEFIILISIPQKHRKPFHVSLKYGQDLEESNEDPDEVEELRVDSDMETDKDDYDEAEREEEMKEEPNTSLSFAQNISQGSI